MSDSNVANLVSLLAVLLALAGTVFTIMANRRRTAAAANSLDARASESAAESVRILLDPLNSRIASLEAQLAAFATREKVLKDEREEREAKHAEEVTGLRNVQAAMQSEMDELRGGVQVLIAQMEAAVPPIIPRWKPRAKTGPLGKVP